MADEPIPDVSPSLRYSAPPYPAAQAAGARILGVFAFVALVAASIVSVGLASIVWFPLLMGIGIAMIVVGSARRKRQLTQGRNWSEVKDPTHARQPWPTKGVTDDRLPEP
jgi:Flp pilus assembly protein TadB